MFLSIFRSNQPYIGFFIPVINALLWSVVLLKGAVIASDFNAPLSFLLPYFQDKWVLFSLGVGLSSLNAILLNVLFNREEYMNKSNSLPALLYSVSVAVSCSSSNGVFILLSHLILMPGIYRIIKIYREPRALGAYFESGFWFALSAMFFTPNLFLIPVAMGCVLYTRPFNFRELIMPLLGGLLPILYLFAAAYLTENYTLIHVWKTVVAESAFSKEEWRLAILFFISAVMVLMSLFLYLKSYARSNNRSRNTKSVFLIICGGLLLTSFTVIFSAPQLIPAIIAPFIAFGGSYLFVDTSGASYREMMFLTWLGLVILYLWEFI
jgi:hypothetical protein